MKLFQSVLIMLMLMTDLSLAGHWEFVGLQDQVIRTIVVSPQDSNCLFASGDSLYKSTDGGLTWVVVSPFPANAIVFQPGKPDTMYFTFGMGTYSDGLYRSTNGGNTWDILHWRGMSYDVFIPTYADSMIFLSSLGNCLLLSYDYGQNWAYFADSALDDSVYTVVSLEKVNLEKSHICGTESGIWYYFNPWLPVGGNNLPAYGMDYYQDHYPWVWAVMGDGSYSDGCYYSSDYGMTWQVSWYFVFPRDILISGEDSTIIFAGSDGCGVVVTTDQGSSWQAENQGLPDSTVWCFAQSPAGPNWIYAGTNQGIYRYQISTGVEETGEEAYQPYSQLLVVMPAVVRGTEIEIIVEIPENQEWGNLNYAITDLSGRIILQDLIQPADQNQVVLNINTDLKSGIYFISIKQKSEILFNKLFLIVN